MSADGAIEDERREILCLHRCTHGCIAARKFGVREAWIQVTGRHTIPHFNDLKPGAKVFAFTLAHQGDGGKESVRKAQRYAKIKQMGRARYCILIEGESM